MTAHELARALLAGPDLPVIHQNDAMRFRIKSVRVHETAYWCEYGKNWIEDQPSVEIVDHTEDLATRRSASLPAPGPSVRPKARAQLSITGLTLASRTHGRDMQA